MAGRLGSALAHVAGVRVAYPVQSNAVFTEVSRDLADRLLRDWSIEVWSESADRQRCVLRWMTAFDTTAEDVATLVASVHRAAADTGAQGAG
jgi:threonine aldolase